jgi:ubiquinone/menaquinone biosynthesis C-methylase UbiE
MDRVARQSVHPLIKPASTADYARESFWDDLTMYLEAEVRPGLRDVYERDVRPKLVEELGREPERAEIAAAMRKQEDNRWWYLLRTQSQRQGIQVSREVVEKQLPELMAQAKARGNGPGSLSLDPDLAIPDYVRGDIHLQRDGYFAASDIANDITAGAVYDRGITLGRMGTQGWLNDDVGLSLAAWMKERFPDFRPKRILELGCTVGHTVVGFKQTYPEAEVHAIDLSAGLLRYAFARSAALGVEIHYHQQNAERTRFDDGSFDLVFSRILMHETSADAMPRIFAECHRLLGEGGVMFHSDAPQYDMLDPYTQSLRDWDATANREPYMNGYYATNLEDAFEQAGFDRATMFRAQPPSLRLKSADAEVRRSRVRGGLYFLAGAVRT